MTKDMTSISQELGLLTDEMTEEIIKLIEKNGTELRDEISEDNPVKTGKMKKSWRIKKRRAGKYSCSLDIYNQDKPTIVHLLAYGWTKRGGKGRVGSKMNLVKLTETKKEKLGKEVEQVITG